MKSAYSKTLSIKAIRENANLTQKNVAIHLGKCRSYVGLIETGQRQPSVATAIKMAKLLNVPPLSIFPCLYELSVAEKNAAGRARTYESATSTTSDYIKIKEMAHMLQIKPERARELCGMEEFPAWKLDREWRIHKKDMLKWLKKRNGMELG